MADETIRTFLGLEELKVYDGKLKEKIAADDATALSAAKGYADSLADNYDPAGTAQTKVTELANGQVKTNKDDISTLKTSVGTLANLDTTAKSNLVEAVNEVFAQVDDATAAGKVTIASNTTTSGMAKSYTVKQGTQTVGVIDIPKDMVVSSGVVEKNPSGQAAGTYLVLTLANASADKVYINVGTLVDIYTAKASATQIQLAIDSSTREISASIVAGSVTATELASNAVTTAKIADKNVTKAKLAADVQTSLNNADSAVQTVAPGSANGTIAVDGSDVAVKGLGSAAYTASTAYDAAGTAETKVTALANGQVATNTANIETLTGKVSSFRAITTAEIEALFATPTV